MDASLEGLFSKSPKRPRSPKPLITEAASTDAVPAEPIIEEPVADVALAEPVVEEPVADAAPAEPIIEEQEADTLAARPEVDLLPPERDMDSGLSVSISQAKTLEAMPDST